MVKDIIENSEYKDLVTKQLFETISFLLEKNSEFALTANIDGINFNPELPEPIHEKLAKFSLFVLSNYTYSTISLNEKNISFEAGFGAEGFGSVVTIPLHAIFQVVIEESILYVNPVATVDKFVQNHEEKSRNIFKNNPKNQKLINSDS